MPVTTPPSSHPLVFHFIGVVFTAIFYGKLSDYIWFRWQPEVNVVRSDIGLYCIIFALYWRIQLERINRRKGLPVYAITASFILCTLYFIGTIIQLQFNITVSYIQLVYSRCPSHGSQYAHSAVRLICEFPGSRAENKLA